MKIVTTLATLALCTSAHAGLFGLTMHSRANCINNESISWDATKAWGLRTISFHDADQYLSQSHNASTGTEATHRSAAICWKEGLPGHRPMRGNWRVVGWHYLLDGKGKANLVQEENITDCSIYDGWFGGTDEPDHPTDVSMDETSIVIGKSYTDVLLNFTKYSRQLASANLESFDKTGLKETASEIPTTFVYNDNKNMNGKILGYAPVGTYTKDKGWSGIKKFMSIPYIGNCSLSRFTMNVEKSRTTDFPYTKSISHDVSGYLYSVEWYTADSWMLFECANVVKDEKILHDMIKIAAR